MLTAIRERATGWIAWVIVVLITIPFALWGINSYFEGGSEIDVATVNGDSISAYAYQEDLQYQTQLLSEQWGRSFDPEMLDDLGIKQQVLDRLIDNRLLFQYTRDNGFRVSDEHLTRLIQEQEAFQVDGQFSLQQYESILSANGFTPQSFEEYQRINEQVSQLTAGLSDSAFVTQAEQDRLLALFEQTRDVEYALIEAADFLDRTEVGNDEAKAYYDQNSDRFMTESRIRVNYIELSVETLAETIVPTEEEISGLYEDTKGKYRTAESRRASHILIGVDQSAPEDERQERLDRASEIYNRALSGEDFSGLAEQYSEDPGSSQNGGDLGIVVPGQMVKPFEDAVFSMYEGEIRGPVETTFGYHVIKLTEMIPEQQQPLSDVREQVAEQIRQVNAENLFADLAEPFKNLVFEDPEEITTAADELDIPVQTSDWFTEASGQGVAAEAKVRRAAFSEDVLVEGLVSQAVEIGFDRLVAVQKLEYEESALQAFEDVEGEVVSLIREEKARNEASRTGEEYLSELKSQAVTIEGWEEYVRKQGLSVQKLPEKRSRSMDFSLLALYDAAFSDARPDEGAIEVGGTTLANGGYALYRIGDVEDGVPSEADEERRDQVSSQLAARESRELYQGFLALLREQADIVVFEDQL